jgi:hypothetical protein
VEGGALSWPPRRSGNRARSRGREPQRAADVPWAASYCRYPTPLIGHGLLLRRAALGYFLLLTFNNAPRLAPDTVPLRRAT